MASLLLGVDLLAAWFFVSALTHPPCLPSPPFPPGFPEPVQVQLNTEDGILVLAWYYPSRNGAAVITLGGLGGAGGAALPPAGPLIEAGYGVLQIGSRACATPVRPVTLGAREALDAAAGLGFLLARPEVANDRIGIFGFSMGAVAAIRVAARDPTVTAVIAEGGYYNLGDDIIEPESRDFLLHEIFLYTVAGTLWLRTGVNPWTISPMDDLRAISPRPVLLIYGEHEAESGRAAWQFAAAGEPKELWIVPGGAHGTNHLVAGAEYERRVLAFLSAALGK